MAEKTENIMLPEIICPSSSDVVQTKRTPSGIELRVRENLNRVVVKESRKSRHNLFMTPTLHSRVRQCAEEAGLSINEFINRVLEAVV